MSHEKALSSATHLEKAFLLGQLISRSPPRSQLHIILIFCMLVDLSPLQKAILLFVAERSLPISIVDHYVQVTGSPIFNKKLRKSISRNELASARRTVNRKLNSLKNPTAFNQASNFESPDLDLLLSHIKPIDSSKEDILQKQIKMAIKERKQQQKKKKKVTVRERDESDSSSDSSSSSSVAAFSIPTPKSALKRPKSKPQSKSTQVNTLTTTRISNGGTIHGHPYNYCVSISDVSSTPDGSMVTLGLINIAAAFVQRGAIKDNTAHDVFLVFTNHPGPSGSDADGQYYRTPPRFVKGRYAFLTFGCHNEEFANVIYNGIVNINNCRSNRLGGGADARIYAAQSLQGKATSTTMPTEWVLCIDFGPNFEAGDLNLLQDQEFEEAHLEDWPDCSLLLPQLASHDVSVTSKLLECVFKEKFIGSVLAIPVPTRRPEALGIQNRLTPNKDDRLAAIQARTGPLKETEPPLSPSELPFNNLRINTGDDDTDDGSYDDTDDETDIGKLFILLF